jgi:predicted enzyme related to lactoylglutathione lyase
MKNAISWFEIGAEDLERAHKFYETIFKIEMKAMDFPNIRMRLFPVEDPLSGISGALVESGGYHKPSGTDGPLIYLNANPDVQFVLDRVEEAGGEILIQKTSISSEFGHIAVIKDSEGNRIALHSAE